MTLRRRCSCVNSSSCTPENRKSSFKCSLASMSCKIYCSSVQNREKDNLDIRKHVFLIYIFIIALTVVHLKNTLLLYIYYITFSYAIWRVSEMRARVFRFFGTFIFILAGVVECGGALLFTFLLNAECALLNLI